MALMGLNGLTSGFHHTISELDPKKYMSKYLFKKPYPEKLNRMIFQDVTEVRSLAIFVQFTAFF